MIEVSVLIGSLIMVNKKHGYQRSSLSNADKSPRPDGFNAGFFQDNWNLVSNDLRCSPFLLKGQAP